MIIQVNIWICENCHKAVTVTREAETFMDEMLEFPDDIEWPLAEIDGDPMNQKNVCPECAVSLENKGVVVHYIRGRTK